MLNHSYSNTLCKILFALFLISIILLSSVPPTSRDALTHHLAIPKLFINHGGIYEIPEMSWSYYPMLLNFLYAIPLYLGNDIVPKYIHFSFGLLTAFLIFLYLKKRTNEVWGLLGAIFFLSIPVIIKLSITVYVDLGLLFFTTASLLLLLSWLDSEFNYRPLILAGIFCGLALSTKYNAIIIFILLSLFVPFLSLRSHKWICKGSAKPVYYTIIFVAAALLIFAPWMLKNYFWTNNPVYPLFNGFFSSIATTSPESPSTQTAASQILQLKHFGRDIFSVRYHVFNESVSQILLLPIRIFFEGQDNNPQYFDGKLNPFLLVLPFFSFINPNKQKQVQFEKKVFLTFISLYLLIALFQVDMRIRYIAPIIPFLVILAIFGLHNIVLLIKCREITSQTESLLKITFITILISAAFLYNSNYLYQQFQEIKPFDYIFGKINREQYITRFRPEFPLIQYANQNLPKDSKILASFLGNRSYYFDLPVEFDFHSASQKSLLCSLTRQHENVEDFLKILNQKGITHILIRYDLFLTWISQQLTLEEQKRLDTFFQTGTTKLAESNNHGLFAVAQKKSDKKVP
jgi:hypothetical protein